MAEISNRMLAILLVAAIVISVGGALINISKLSELTRDAPLLQQLTGLAVTRGTVNITIASQVEVNLSTYEIDFGPGFVSASFLAARLNTSSGTFGKENWTNATLFLPNNITIENTGNRNCSVNFTSDKLAAAFIGGGAGTIPDPSFQFRGVLKTAGACSAANLTSTYTEVITAEENDLCKCLRFEDGNDQIYMNAQVIIPQDAPIGAKNATLVFIASDWSNTNKVC